MKHLIIPLCLTLFIGLTACKNDKQSVGDIKVVSPQEMQSLLKLDDVQLVDVRTPEEYKDGFIANAQNIDFKSPTFDEDIKKLDKAKPVIVYCKSGKRSAKSAQKLKEEGFTIIYDLEGGFIRWQHDGMEIETEE